MKVYAATGHRPDKLGGYSPAAFARLCLFAHKEISLIDPLPVKLISGMAMGWDQAVTLAALSLNIPVQAAIPFDGQDAKWPSRDRKRYQEILSMVLETGGRVTNVSPGRYDSWKLQIRNEYMVNSADHILALWNGSPGGTANTVDYAQRHGRALTNLWPQWLDYK